MPVGGDVLFQINIKQHSMHAYVCPPIQFGDLKKEMKVNACTKNITQSPSINSAA